MQNLSCENDFYLHEHKNEHFHINCFALSLALKQRLGATRNGLAENRDQGSAIGDRLQKKKRKLENQTN